MANGTQMMFDLSDLETSQLPIVGASELHAKTSPLRETWMDSEEVKVSSLGKSFGFLKDRRIDPNGYSMKMLKECYRAIRDGIISPLSLQWSNWGTMSSGNFSTQRISESRRTGSEFILSDILEEEVDEKYFLSQEQMEKITFYK